MEGGGGRWGVGREREGGWQSTVRGEGGGWSYWREGDDRRRVGREAAGAAGERGITKLGIGDLGVRAQGRPGGMLGQAGCGGGE